MKKELRTIDCIGISILIAFVAITALFNSNYAYKENLKLEVKIIKLQEEVDSIKLQLNK